MAPPGSESARSFVYGARFFRRLLHFWGSLRWPASGTSAVREAITWVELTLFFELAVDAELTYCVEGKIGGRPEHFRDEGSHRAAERFLSAERSFAATTY